MTDQFKPDEALRLANKDVFNMPDGILEDHAIELALALKAAVAEADRRKGLYLDMWGQRDRLTGQLGQLRQEQRALEAENQRLRETFTDALPHIECSPDCQYPATEHREWCQQKVAAAALAQKGPTE